MTDLLDMGIDTSRDQHRRRGAVVVILAALVLIGALGTGYVFVKRLVGQPAVTDYPGPGSGPVIVTIDPGSSLSDIGVILAGSDVVLTRKAFVEAATANPAAHTIAAGTYQLLKQMKAADAVTYLIGVTHRLSLHVVVPEGFEVDQVLQALANTNHITKQDLQLASRNIAALKLPPYSTGHLEGFLFPATYDFEPGTTAQKALAAMIDRFNQAASAPPTGVGLAAGAAKLKLTPYQVLIVASIVEREAKNLNEYGKVARVVYNRLAKDMPLQMDSTSQYAVDSHKLHLSIENVNDDSYNSYKHNGLPPTPIANPGQASMLAALNPDDGAWLYFIAFKDGTTRFATTYRDFVKLKNDPNSAIKKPLTTGAVNK